MRNINVIQRAQRTIALKVARAYKTVFIEAIIVVARLLPVHLLDNEQQRRYVTKQEIRIKLNAIKLKRYNRRSGIQQRRENEHGKSLKI